MMDIQWIRCQNHAWCSLNAVDLAHRHFIDLKGIYIIWYEQGHTVPVRIGQGFIADRLKVHRVDSEVQAFSSMGLLATWASVEDLLLDGVEAYLGSVLMPKVGTRFPDAIPIKVNLPW